ncbi:MAG: hypothetical protein EXR72_11575 [Myxococcales bacterium]|nr:hypothetical protein [Myxococcales bacterium]
MKALRNSGFAWGLLAFVLSCLTSLSWRARALSCGAPTIQLVLKIVTVDGGTKAFPENPEGFRMISPASEDDDPLAATYVVSAFDPDFGSRGLRLRRRQ